MTDLRFNKQDDPELERLVKIRNNIRNQYLSDIKRGKTFDHQKYIDIISSELRKLEIEMEKIG